MTKEQAIQAKAKWLSQCLEFGWKHSDLDNLSEVWDRFKDEYGNMRPSTPSLNAGNLEEAEPVYHDYKADWEYHCRVSGGYSYETFLATLLDDPEFYKLWCSKKEQRLHQSSRPSLDIDKVVEQLREANHYESWPNKRIWNQACDELQKILNQKEGK